MPLQYGACAVVKFFLYLKGQLIPSCSLGVNGFCEHLLRTDGQHLIIIGGAVVIAQSDDYLLF